MKNKVLVIGDCCIDRFVYGKCERLCPDIPVPVFIPKETKENMGMAGNVYNNLVSLGVNCTLVSPQETIIKERYVDKQTNYTFLRVDRNSPEPTIPKTFNDVRFRSFLDKHDRVQSVSFVGSDLNRKSLAAYEAIVVADYGKGFLNEDAISHICDLNENVFLDTKKILGEFCRKAKFIKINELEFKAIQHDIHMPSWADKLIVTLGERGCMYGEKFYPTEKVEVYDLSGAGDTFLAAFVAKHLETKNHEDAIKYANDCSTKVVQLKGVATPEPNEQL